MGGARPGLVVGDSRQGRWLRGRRCPGRKLESKRECLGTVSFVPSRLRCLLVGWGWKLGVEGEHRQRVWDRLPSWCPDGSYDRAVV